MEDPVGEMRQIIPMLDFWWDKMNNSQRTVKLAAVVAHIKKVQRIVQDEIDRCLQKSSPY